MRRRFWPVLGVLASIALALVYAAWPGTSTFTVGSQTTYITGPLDKHGYVDYVTALNERLSKGITPENNANVLIWQAVGPRPEGAMMPPEYFQWLRIESPPEEGEYLVSWQSHLRERSRGSIELNEYYERMSRAAEWPWTGKDEPELADWLKRNEKPLALMMDATRRPAYYNPLVPERSEEWSPGLFQSRLPTVQRCREVASALACRAMLRVTGGQIDEAWQDLLACHRLGRLVARGGSLIEMLVGLAIDHVAAKADIAFLDHAQLTSQQVLAFLEDLRKLPPMPAVADKMDLGERFSLLDTIMRLKEGHQITARLFTKNINWDPAFRNANRWIDRCSTGLRLADRSARIAEMAAIDRELKTLKQQISDMGFLEKSLMRSGRRGETIGNELIVTVLSAFNRVQSSAERGEQEQRNLHLALLLAAHLRDYGTYPGKLDELAPKYLAKIPDDLFSNGPLIYRPEGRGYLLYSVGPNGIDDEGRGFDDDPQGDDLSVRMPVPKPRRKE